MRLAQLLPAVRRYTTAITQNDIIHRVNLRVGQIVSIEKHPEASHLFIEQVDIAEEKTRTIVSGLAPYVPMESLMNKKVVVVSNLKPSKFRGVLSEGMLLAASSADGKKVAVLEPAMDSPVGERVRIEGLEPAGEPDPVLKPKQKVFETVAADLCTDAEGVVTFKGSPMVTSAGKVACPTVPNGQIS
ncbi:hypothetical protein BX666DRAFT_2005577 [Dichotomocladium elegans]|nr:hypothetical protein BX666DRAFT_2005577 [Dichotomocladium elegans]